MNSKKMILLSCVVPCVFAVSTATAQMRGHRASTARMPMHRAPMLNSASGFHRFNAFDRDDRFRRFNRFNDRREDRFESHHPFFNDRREDRFEDRRFFRNRFVNNRFVFIGDFGFPWWWGWGWGPWWGWNWGYPYGYYGGYGSGYGYGDSSQSRVAELQRRLASAGYYHGAIDGIMGPATRRAIRAYERDHGYVG
jgi:Putative peptidoglycan binding domain